jgi:hypothetical protein
VAAMSQGRSEIVTVQASDGRYGREIWMRTGEAEVFEPRSEADVMHDVTEVMRAALGSVRGTQWSEVGRLLVPLAFRLLCMAAFRPCRCPVEEVRYRVGPAA